MIPYGFIYITTNKVNGKQYIGQCSYKKKRWQQYLGSGVFLKRALKKYGRESFSREIIIEAFTKEDLAYLEILIIAEYNAVKNPNFYNMAEGGYITRGFTGKKHSEERNANLSDKMKGHAVTQNVIDNMRRIGKIYGPSSNNLKHFESGKSHINAKEVVLDGVVYETIAEAAIKTGYSAHLIRRYLKLGIHPNNPNRKTKLI